MAKTATKPIAQTKRELKRIYREALEKIRGRLATIYEKYSTDGSLTYAEMTKYNRMTALEKEITAILNEGNGEAVKKIARLPKDVYEEAFFHSGWSVDMAAGVGVKWGMLNPDVVSAAVDNPLYHLAIKGMRQNALVAVNRTIASGLTMGQSFPQMARAMADTIGRTYNDSLRIARTEGMRAMTMGERAALDRAEEKGVQIKEIWTATLDDRTRDSHGDLDGVEKQERGWYVGGVWCDGPRLSGIAAEDINCRCTITANIEGLEPTLRRSREGVVPYTTYKDWRANMEEHGGQYVPSRYITLPEERENFERNTERQ